MKLLSMMSSVKLEFYVVSWRTSQYHSVTNKLSAMDLRMMRLVRRLFVTVLTFNCYFKSKHIPGKTNCPGFRGNQPDMSHWLQQRPTTIPATILPLRR